MDFVQISVLLAIGGAASAMLHRFYFRKEVKPVIEQKIPVENLVGAQIPVAENERGIVPLQKIGYSENKDRVPKIKTAAPLKGVCNHCKKDYALPFRCKFCTNLFCGEHRLPENHNCENL